MEPKYKVEMRDEARACDVRGIEQVKHVMKIN